MFLIAFFFVAVFTGAVLPESVRSAKFDELSFPKKVSVAISPKPIEKLNVEAEQLPMKVEIKSENATNETKPNSEKQSAFNTASEKTVKSVSTRAIENSSVLEQVSPTPTILEPTPTITQAVTPTPTLSQPVIPLPTIKTPCDPIMPMPNQLNKNLPESIPCLN